MGALLAAACLLVVPVLTSAGSGAPARAATSTPSTVTVQFVGPSGQPTGISRTFGAPEVPGLGLDVQAANYQHRTSAGLQGSLYNVYGVSILALIAQRGAVAADVTGVVVSAQGNPPITLRADLGDLTPPTPPGVSDFPYLGSLPPVLTVDQTTGEVDFIVNPRTVESGIPGVVDDGAYVAAVNGVDMTITIQLDGSLLYPEVVSPPTTVTAEQPVVFTGGFSDGSPTGSYTWSWDFEGSDPGPTDGVTLSHTFRSAGSYHVTVAAQGGPPGSSGLSPPVTVVVTAATKSNPPPSPTPTPSASTSRPTVATSAPTGGGGPRLGGVPTSRTGSGAPGPTYDPRSAAASASGSGAEVGGQLVGYLLSGPTADARQRSQAAARPVDDAAPAARDGVAPGGLGWLAGVLVVILLLILGAGTERRRPTGTRRHR